MKRMGKEQALTDGHKLLIEYLAKIGMVYLESNMVYLESNMVYLESNMVYLEIKYGLLRMIWTATLKKRFKAIT